MKKRQRPEQLIQRAVCDHLRLRGVRGLIWWATPNGGKRSPIEAAIFKGQGVKRGVCDICCLHDSKFFALELKAEGGRLTEEQREYMDAVNNAGGYATCAVGIDQAVKALKDWSLIR